MQVGKIDAFEDGEVQSAPLLCGLQVRVGDPECERKAKDGKVLEVAGKYRDRNAQLLVTERSRFADVRVGTPETCGGFDDQPVGCFGDDGAE